MSKPIPVNQSPIMNTISLQFDVVTTKNSNGIDTILRVMRESDYDYTNGVVSIVLDDITPNGYESVTVSVNSYTLAIYLVADYLQTKHTLVTPEDVETYTRAS